VIKEFDEAVNEMAQNVEKRMIKACKRLYEPIQRDDSFENYLDGLTKAELDNISHLYDFIGGLHLFIKS